MACNRLQRVVSTQVPLRPTLHPMAPSGRERANLWIVSAAQFLTLAGMTAVLPLVPLYLRELGVEDPDAVKHWAGILGSAPFVVAVLVTPLWGAWADRVGYKPMLVRAAAGIALATIGMGLASTPHEMLGWRCVQGAVSGVFPAAVALLSASTPPERLGEALAVLQSARSAGGLSGPLLGGTLSDVIGIRALFLVVGAISALTAGACWWIIDEGPRPDPHAQDRGGVRLAVLVRQPAVLAVLALLILFQASGMTWWPTLALFVEQFGVGERAIGTVTGLLVFTGGLPAMLLAPRWARLARRLGIVPLLAASLLGSGLAGAGMGLVHSLPIVFALRVVAGVSMAGFVPLAFEWLNGRVPTSARGRMAGVGSTAMLLGNVIGPPLGGWLGVRYGIGATFWVPGVASATAGALLLVTQLTVRGRD